MTKWNLWILLVLAITQQGFSQEFKFLGEVHENKVVLAWIPKSWPEEMSGVFIKKQQPDGSWTNVSQKEIVPAAYPLKDLTPVEVNAVERERLASKLQALIDAGRAKPVSEQEFKTKLAESTNVGASIAMIFAMDYDLMLLNGFGLVDRTQPQSKVLTYGVFPVISGSQSVEPAAVVTISDEVRTDFVIRGQPQVVGNNKRLRLVWEFSLKDYRKQNFKGFDIVKQDSDKATKLNKNTIWITSNQEPGVLSFLADFPEERTTYTAIPISFFGTPSKSSSIQFDPAIYTAVIPSPRLSGEVIESAAVFNWTFDHSVDTLLKSITIARRENDSFLALDEFPPDQRSYTLNNLTTGISRYRITLQTKSGRQLHSNESIIQFIPKPLVPAPENLIGKVITNPAGNYIELSWEYPQGVDSLSFRIFTEGPRGELIYSASLSKDVRSPFRIEVKTAKSIKELYAIQAIDAKRNMSLLSNTVEIITPSAFLPKPQIKAVQNINGENVLQWNYSESYHDLKGFEVYVDGHMVKDAYQLGASTRELALPRYEPGIHVVSLKAVSIYDLVSNETTPFKYKSE